MININLNFKNKRVILAFSLLLFFVLWGLSYFHGSYFTPVYLFLGSCLLLTNLFCVFFVLKESVYPWKIALLIIALGTLYSIVLPACTVPDEDRHFARAYKVSNFILNGESLSGQNKKMLMRADIVDSLLRDYDGGDWIDYYKGFFDSNDEKEIVFDNLDVISQAPPYYHYIYPGIVISFCRILKMSARMLLFTGREFNLLLFACLLYLSIKIFPQMAAGLSAIALFPMTLVLAASYSYDSIIISTLFLLFAMLMRCITKEGRVSVKEMLGISLLFMLVIPIKLVYFPFVLLFFCIDRKKFGRTWHKYVWILAVAVITVMIMVACQGEMVRFFLTRHYTPVAVEETQPTNDEYVSNSDIINPEHIWNMSDVKSNPLGSVGVLFRSLFNTSNQLFMNISGYYFGWFTYEIPITIACIFPLLFVLSVGTDSGADINRVVMIIISVVVSMSFCLVMVSMLLAETPYGFAAVRGAQGRYFTPLMPLVALLLRQWNVFKTTISRSGLISISVFANSVVMLYLFNDIINL